jgi:hypothetical protein
VGRKGEGRRSRSRPLARRVGDRLPKKTIVVFREGVTTEPEYINALKPETTVRDTAAVDIRVDASGGAVPGTLVKRALAFKERAEEIDEIWCIFDVEWPKNHPGLQRAVSDAKVNGTHLAVSNPRFEIWLVLHFNEYAAWVDSNSAQRLRREYDRQPRKSLSPDEYPPRREDAVRRAAALYVRHEGNGTEFPHNNPSSGMYHFIRSVSP